MSNYAGGGLPIPRYLNQFIGYITRTNSTPLSICHEEHEDAVCVSLAFHLAICLGQLINDQKVWVKPIF